MPGSWQEKWASKMPELNVKEETKAFYQNFLIVLSFAGLIPIIVKIYTIFTERTCKRESIKIYLWSIFIQLSWSLNALMSKNIFSLITNTIAVFLGLTLIFLIYRYGSDDIDHED